MDGIYALSGLIILMFLGSLLAGSLPLAVTFSEDKLKKATVFGAGLLVGTALAVIIPEGVRSLGVKNVSVSITHGANQPEVTATHTDSITVIGVCLVVGFVFMLLIDQFSQNAGRNVTATIGLVVHAAADGVALGAAATTSHADVEIIVFLAIMLHKAPAAFGLVTFLLHEGVDRQRIRAHLIVFSAAAPLLALITYAGLNQKGKEALDTFNATGIAMLISGGTFLYVATVHVLADITHAPPKQYSRLSNAESGVKVVQSGRNLICSELIWLVGGCLMPLILTVGHQH